MAESPSEVDTAQLDDLGIAIKEHGEMTLRRAVLFRRPWASAPTHEHLAWREL